MDIMVLIKEYGRKYNTLPDRFDLEMEIRSRIQAMQKVCDTGVVWRSYPAEGAFDHREAIDKYKETIK